MTPKEILRLQVVGEMFDDVMIDDLSFQERRAVTKLVDLGVLKLVPWGDSDFKFDLKIVKINQEYFNEDQSPAVEEPKET